MIEIKTKTTKNTGNVSIKIEGVEMIKFQIKPAIDNGYDIWYATENTERIFKHISKSKINKLKK